MKHKHLILSDHKDKEKIANALQLPYSNAKLEATNNLIKLIKRNAFGFRNFENFKKQIFITLNIKKERTKFVLSRFQLFFNPLQLTILCVLLCKELLDFSTNQVLFCLTFIIFFQAILVSFYLFLLSSQIVSLVIIFDQIIRL